MDLGLKKRVALVAASSQGLGLAVAEELAAEGSRLVMCARGDELLRSSAGGIAEKYGVEVEAASGDLSVQTDLERIFDCGIRRFGQIDILVTNSGGPAAGKFDGTSPEDWDSAVRGLLNSAVQLTRLVLPGMKERRWGRILHITSIAAKQPVDILMLSNSIRAAVTGFSKTLSNEVAEFGVTVNTILPGYTATERVKDLACTLAKNESVTEDDIFARWESEIPMRRLALPEEFAALATFLVSERASYITGSSIAVDGGWIRSLY